MNKQATYNQYYRLGQEYALTKIAEKVKSKALKTTKRKAIGKAGGKASAKAAPAVTEKLISNFSTKGQKAIGKGVLTAGKRLGLGLDLLDDITNLPTAKGREKIKDKYRPYVQEGKDGLDSMAADAINILLPTNPVSAAASGGRMVHRSLKGAKKTEKNRVQTAKELEEAIEAGDKDKAQQKRESIRVQTEAQPRFNSSVGL